MNAQSTIAKLERTDGRWPAAGGALAMLALASGLALGLGAVVDRLTISDEEARVLSAGAAQDSTIASATECRGPLEQGTPGHGACVDRSCGGPALCRAGR